MLPVPFILALVEECNAYWGRIVRSLIPATTSFIPLLCAGNALQRI